MLPRPPSSTLFPYTTLFRSELVTVPARWSGPRRLLKTTSWPVFNASRANASATRSEEHTSELQSHVNLVCRLLLEKKNKGKHQEERGVHRVAGGDHPEVGGH